MDQFLDRVYRSLGRTYPDKFSLDWLDEVLNHPSNEVADILTRRLVALLEKRCFVILVKHLSLLLDKQAPKVSISCVLFCRSTRLTRCLTYVNRSP